MKKLSWLFAAMFLPVMFIGCSDDDDCDNLDTVIIGRWSMANQGTVEFQSDGDLIDPDCLLLEINDLDVKTWTLDESLLTITVTNDTESSIASTELTVTDYSCNTMTVGIPALGIAVTLNKQ